MKIHITVLILLTLFVSCSSTQQSTNTPIKINNTAHQTLAVFKSIEQSGSEEYRLIFRKLDDCQYIIFTADLKKIEASDIIIKGVGGEIIANNDYINFRYKIEYIQEPAYDSLTAEKININRLISLNRASSDRFSEAGFQSDLPVYDFIVSFKQSVLLDSSDSIAQMINYPIHTVIKKKKIKISRPEEFIKYYHSIITKKIRESILNVRLADIKSTPKGLVIGDNEVLIKMIDDRIQIVSFNSY